MKLHQIDLNLLLLFDALYRHRSVSGAADEISLSQSAFSHALSRLRVRLDDELFIRSNNVMQPTLKGELIAEKLSRALPLMQQALNETIEFDPATSELEFKFTATDFT
ncbi:MAG: LysR family transcriptional regulator, partial [Pseudomonadales bacterium]|nr:LysR family transcriptional regulator [Pseudomonadales bacterium]